MGNKNTIRLRKFFSSSARKGHFQVEIDVPGKNYHNSSKATMITRRLDLSKTDAPHRNMKMVVLKNTNAESKSESLTRHTPIVASRPVIHKNHSYMQDQYSQPKSIRN